MKNFIKALVVISFAALLTTYAADSGDQSSLKRRLMGEWEIVADADGKALPDGHVGEVKFIGQKRWTVVRIDPKTKKLTYTLGGTYQLTGDTYAETVDFCSPSIEKDVLGHTFTFKVTVEGDTYTQRGQGNPFNQQFRRAK